MSDPTTASTVTLSDGHTWRNDPTWKVAHWNLLDAEGESTVGWEEMPVVDDAFTAADHRAIADILDPPVAARASQGEPVELPPEGEPINDKLMRLCGDLLARRVKFERHSILRDVEWEETDRTLLRDVEKKFSEARQEARKYEEIARGYLAPAAPSAPLSLKTERLYHELLYAVGNKYKGETRHQTALRYLREREAASLSGEAKQDIAHLRASLPEKETP